MRSYCIYYAIYIYIFQGLSANSRAVDSGGVHGTGRGTVSGGPGRGTRGGWVVKGESRACAAGSGSSGDHDLC